MDKNLAIFNEMRAAAERVFNEGINAPAGVYSLAELSKVGTICKTARRQHHRKRLAFVGGILREDPRRQPNFQR